MINVRKILYNHEDMRRLANNALERERARLEARQAEIYSSLYPSLDPEGIHVMSSHDPDMRLVAALDKLEEVRKEYEQEAERLERIVADLDKVERVARALQERYRAVIVPRFYEGQDREETCEQVGIKGSEYYRRIDEGIRLISAALNWRNSY